MDLGHRHPAVAELGLEAFDHRRGPADQGVSGGEVAELLFETLCGEETVHVARHDDDTEVRAQCCDRLQFVQEVSLVCVLDAVVEVDGRALLRAEASGHAQEGRDADTACQPDLPRAVCAVVRERSVGALDDRLGARLESPERPRVVADGLDRDP
jgi:hypothetical protein